MESPSAVSKAEEDLLPAFLPLVAMSKLNVDVFERDYPGKYERQRLLMGAGVGL